MGRSPPCSDIIHENIKKGPWTPEEDQKLINYIQHHGHASWRALPQLADLNRCGKSCRLRWTNYLRPDIKRGKFETEEEQTILNLHSILGNKWSAIASHLPGRTDNEIKNFWNTHLKKKLIQRGFDPMTHRPRTDILPQLIALANSEAVQLANLQFLQLLLQDSANLQLGSFVHLPNLQVPGSTSSIQASDFTNNSQSVTPSPPCPISNSPNFNYDGADPACIWSDDHLFEDPLFHDLL